MSGFKLVMLIIGLFATGYALGFVVREIYRERHREPFRTVWLIIRVAIPLSGLLMLLSALAAFPAPAHAAEPQRCTKDPVGTNNWTCPDKGLARAWAETVPVIGQTCPNTPAATFQSSPRTATEQSGNFQVQGMCRNNSTGALVASLIFANISWTATCNSRNGAANLGAHYMDPRPSFTLERCVAGCVFKMVQPFTTTRYTNAGSGGSAVVYRGVMEYTGDICPATSIGEEVPDGEEPTDPPKEECVQVAGQTMCKKPDGKNCYTASTGRRICWDPTETGTKEDGDTTQTQNPATDPPPTPPTNPPPQPPPTTKPPITTTTTTTTGGSTTTTSTTTTRTHTGVGRPGGTNPTQGEDDGQEGGEEDGEGETGNASTNCTAEPTCSSADGIGCAILRQSWLNHCKFAADLNTYPDPTGEGDISAWEADAETIFGEGDDDGGWGSVDTDGWSGRGSCPIVLEFSAMGRAFNIDHPQLCEVLDALAALVLLVASIHGAIILGGGRT